ncbi:hypothetical protein GCM10007966_04530 [Legionella impletisoli]|uniref:Uncharacterized protein n=1 Tax=Legionella impletisoli TaxID=343510 RepID=A0A917JQW7_9GAMM|nr:hypothetical protein GCM10007966_04530 [Legionella impletisoli]
MLDWAFKDVQKMQGQVLSLDYIAAYAPRLDRGVQGFSAVFLDSAVKPRNVGRS